MLKTTTCVLNGLLCLLAATTQAQQWRVGLLGVATSDRISNDFQLRVANPGSNPIQVTHAPARGYGLGLSIERELNDHWSLEAQPRYQRLRTDFRVHAGRLASYGYVAGPVVQLPIGGRYSFGASRRLAPYVLGHAVLSWSNLRPKPLGLLPDAMGGPAQMESLGYAAPGEQWQLGLEAGGGVRLADLLALNLLAYYGLSNTRLATVRNDRHVPINSGSYTQQTTIGDMRGHLFSVALQGVLYLHH